MKRTIAVFMSAMLLALVLPAGAFAQSSPSTEVLGTATHGDITIVVIGSSDLQGFVFAEPSDTLASNVPSGVTPEASFRIYSVPADLSWGDGVLASFCIGAGWVGQTVTVYFQSVDGTTRIYRLVVDESGYITLPDAITQETWVSIVLPDKGNGTGEEDDLQGADEQTSGSVEKDTSAISPQTGVDVTLYAVAAGALLLVASVVLIARRKVEK